MVNGAVLTSEKEAQRLAVNQRVVDGHASQGVAAQELVVTDGILNRSLSIGLSDPCRVGHHLVVGVKRTKVDTFVLVGSLSKARRRSSFQSNKVLSK